MASALIIGIDVAASCLYEHLVFLHDPKHRKSRQDPLGPNFTWAYCNGCVWVAMISAMVTVGYLECTPGRIV